MSLRAPPIERELAPFKINLMLHVTGKRPDGYHALETLFAFAEYGDALSWEASGPLGLTVTGPFAHVAPATDDNLVLRAARVLAAAYPEQAKTGGQLALQKNVPAGAGLGGGSADAAACLRLLNRVWALGLDLTSLSHFAAQLGADVPACLFSRPAWARGKGEELHFLQEKQRLPLLVVYPGRPVATKDVFSSDKLLFSIENPHWPPAAPRLSGPVWRNDLALAASHLSPEIAQLLADLERMRQTNEDILVTGMSGSGSACFALCRTDTAMHHLAVKLRASYRAAWVCETKLLSPFV